MSAAVQIWILSGVVFVLFGLLSFVFKKIVDRLIKKLDLLIDQVTALTTSEVLHRNELNGLVEANKKQDNRLNDQSRRIRKLEIELSSLKKK